MKRWMKNRKLLGGIALVVVLLIVANWPSAIPVDTAPVARGALHVTVEDEGETRVRERFVVSAPVAGSILRIELEPGDRVERGKTVLTTFRPAAPTPLDARTRAQATARLAAAQAGLERAKAEKERTDAVLEGARDSMRRLRALAREELVSADTLERQETELRVATQSARAADSGVQVAEQELAVARAQLQFFDDSREGGSVITLRSPIDGVVLKRLRESEAVVQAGAPLLELGDPRQLEIVADFLSSDAVAITPGDDVRIERWGGDRALRGTVRRVEPSGFMKISALGVEEQRVNVVVDFADPVEAWSRLGDGYRVEVAIVVWSADDVLKVPTSALFRRGDAWAVFAMEGGRTAVRELQLGQRNGLEAQVASGIDEGAIVVVHPSDSLEEGVRIAQREG